MRGPARKRKGGAAMALAAALVLVSAMPVPAGAGDEEAWDAERAFVEMERLQTEIGLLRALAGAQAALLAWTLVPENRERSESGGALEVLAPHLCIEEALRPWCRALPATFGAEAAMAADDANGKDGGR